MIRSAAPSMLGRSLQGRDVRAKTPRGRLQESTSSGRYTHGGTEGVRTLISTAGRSTVGRTLPRRHAWGVVSCLALVSGLLFLPAASANAATASADLAVSGSIS